ncbi:alpha/beta hydrolase [Sphingomonas sp. Leaf62]|uniref:alpha/beta hydrolase n=1 Tax=Sphingomonas sp. Leaf62 TaxID=1736228 RepID=UPI000A70C498|nr:alpha/beta hydrolase-fold protein [Sphingomonas sp. Leaf62]
MRAILWAVLLATAVMVDSDTIASVPPGRVVQPARLEGPFELHSRIYPGTVRRYWVYVPEGYDPKRPPNLLLFQDGQRAVNPDGSLRVPAVLDALIRRRAIPATLGIFVTPGHRALRYPDTLGSGNPDHRVEEYDAITDSYARMTLDELLPTVARRWHFTMDPKRRAIGGTSSGAIASWTVAWRHPEAFANVLSFIGSYTSIGLRLDGNGVPTAFGGDIYPGLSANRRSARSAFSCRTAGTISTTNMATGFWPTSKW